MKIQGGLGEGTAARDGRLWLAVVVSAFVLSRALFYSLGIRFNVEGLAWYWQFLDPEILRSDPVGSVLWLHMQPPLFNGFVGVVLAVAGARAMVVMNFLYLLMSGALAVVVYTTLLELGWPCRPSALLVCALMLTPGWLMYESWLFYDFPSAFLLAVALLALLRCGRRGSAGWLAVFVWSCCGLALMRSIFHLVWLAAAMALVLMCRVRLRRKSVCWVLLPVVIVAGVYAKNLVAFGVFGPSSWLGMSLAKMTVARLDPAERGRMVRAGELSRYVLVPPFSPLESYEAAAGTSFADGEQPVLGNRLKSTGAPNFNHRAFVSVSRALKNDALVVVRARPTVYLGAVETAWRRFFSPVVAYPPFADNLLVIAPLFHLSQATIGQPVFAVVAFLAAVVIAIVGSWKARAAGDRGLQAGAAFVLLNLVWVAAVGNLLEVGENHRFRFVVTPLVWLTLSAAFSPLFRRRSG